MRDTTTVEVPVERAVIAASDKGLALADAAEFPGTDTVTDTARGCGPGRLDAVATDATVTRLPGAPSEVQEGGVEAGVEVVVTEVRGRVQT